MKRAARPLWRTSNASPPCPASKGKRGELPCLWGERNVTPWYLRPGVTAGRNNRRLRVH